MRTVTKELTGLSVRGVRVEDRERIPMVSVADQVHAQAVKHALYNSAQEDSGQWQYILEQESILQELELSLKGYCLDYVKQEFVKPEFSRPLLNDEGVALIMSRIRSLVSKNTVANRFEIEEIHRRVLILDWEIIDLIEDYYKRFGVDPVKIPTIINLCDSYAFTALKRSDRGNTQELLKPILKFVDSKNVREDDKAGMTGGFRK